MLSSWKPTAGAVCTAAKSLLTATNPFIQQTRNTFILKRKYEPPLNKKGGSRKTLNHKYFIYDVVENTDIKPKPPLDVILTQYVAGYGEKGTKISLKPNFAYNNFLLPGLAVYASPENIQKYLNVEKKEEKVYSSMYVPMTLRLLNRLCVIVNMSIENPWVLEKWHLRANIRRNGYIVTEDAITMPEKEISGPNLDIENKDFYITITVNKTEKVIVKCRIHHVTYDLSMQLPEIEDHQFIESEPIFPEDKEVLDSLPKPVNPKKKKKIIY